MSAIQTISDISQSPNGAGSPSTSRRPVPPGASRRRDKPQLSCHQCRRRKSRCDRRQPCSSCSSRDQLCTYPAGSANDDSPRSSQPSTAKGANWHDRLAQLESLVLSLKSDAAQNATPASPRPVPSPAPTSSECGSMRVSSAEHRYVGGDHWAAILDGIADLKDHFDREDEFQLTEQDEGEGEEGFEKPLVSRATLLYGCRRVASRDEVVAALPPKAEVDRYISRYFNRLDLVASAIHGPSFLEEAAFWTNPSDTPVIWIGLLFGMLCLAVLASDDLDSTQDSQERQSLQIGLYREKIVQCLVMGQYTKAGPHVLETVIHYVYVEFLLRTDANKDVWFLLALQINLAMRMGYHRDPSHFPHISPLQGEMRRRLWATILMSDILISSQMGMPRMISQHESDTAEPRNLNDDDLSKSTTLLPPSRPETERTTTLGCIARRRMSLALGAIMDLTSAVQPCSYTHILELDAALHTALASTPPLLRMKPMAASLTDSPRLIMARLFLAHMFHKGQLILHRRFSHAKGEAFAYSRESCVEGALGSLGIQQVMDEETGPGGQIHALRWRVTSIMNHQFLTATMVLCGMLQRGQVERKEEILAALRKTREIWLRRSAVSEEARKAAQTVSFVLARAGVHQGEGPDCGGEQAAFDAGIGHFGAAFEGDGMGSSGMKGFWGTFMPLDQQFLNFNFEGNEIERDAAMDDWTDIGGVGRSWQ